jgi:4-amino-4-deoxy-L-arabinose transferase-like glycosyltransferase
MQWPNGRVGNFGVLFIATFAYCTLHALLRYGASRTLGSEDSLSLVYAQDWAFGYTSDKPPLYIWMLAAVQTVIGPNILAVLSLKYGLLITTSVFTYLAGYRLLHDRLWATLAAFSLSLCFEIGWTMHEGVTYSAALTTMVMATLWSVFRLRDRGSWLDYLLFGSFSAFGLLSNYNFIFFLVALILSGLSLRSFRRRFQSPRALLSLVIMLALIAPFCFWLITEDRTVNGAQGHDGRAVPSSHSHQMSADSSRPQAPGAAAKFDPLHRTTGQLGGRFEQLLEKGYFHRSFTALLNMLQGPVLFLFPLIPLLPLLFPGLASNLFRAIWTFGDKGLENDSERLLLRMTVVALGFLLLAVSIGFDRGGSQYMHPLFLPTVLLVVTLAKHQMRSPRQIGAYLLALLIVSVGIVGLRVFGLLVGPPMCGPCETWERFEPLARALQLAGYGDMTIFTTDRTTAGNLRQLLPMAHVGIAERRRLIPWPLKVDVAAGPITVITRAEQGDINQWINLLCATHNGIESSVTPSRTFTVTADWRGRGWEPPWHPKSVWHVSGFQAGELCSPNGSAPAHGP